MNNSLVLKVVFLAIMLTSLTDLTRSIALNDNTRIKNTTESVNFQIEQADDEYPSDSYYYDNYEANSDLNPDQIDKKQLFLNANTNTQQTTHNSNNNNNNNINKTNNNAQQPQIIKQLENNLNSLIKLNNNNNNIINNHTGAAYDYVDHENLEDVDTNTSGGNNEDEDLSETEDVSHVVIINAEQENDYQLDEASKTNDFILKPSVTTTRIPEQHVSSVVSLEEKKINTIDTINPNTNTNSNKNNDYKETDEHRLANEHKQADFKSKTVAANRNYLTFLVLLVSIGVVLTGLTIVIVLFVKRRSLLLKSKCQIVSKTKGQQSYTTVGQNDF